MILPDQGTSFQGRHALVTGGSRGIGRAIAHALTVAGARVTILGRDVAALDAAVNAGAADTGIVADITDETAVNAVLNRLPPVDILVTNAGAAATAPFAKTDSEIIRRMIDINLLGCSRFVQGLAPAMIKRGSGRIVAIASTAGLKGYGYVSAYVAAKHAVVGYVRAVAVEIAKTGVTINAVCPGFTDTDLVAESLDKIVAKTGRSREAALAELTKHNPQGRLVAAGEVADAVLWLCGSGSTAINGQAIAVAGGEI